MRVGDKEKCCEKDCKTPKEYMDNHFRIHVVEPPPNKEEEKEYDKEEEEK